MARCGLQQEARMSESDMRDLSHDGAIDPDIASLIRAALALSLSLQCSANRSRDPIVPGKRSNSYTMNYPELQARIEMAHRPLIEVDDATGR